MSEASVRIRNGFVYKIRASIGRLILVGVIIAGAMGATASIHPPIASASARGCTLYGKPKALASFCGNIVGSGLHVQSFQGAYAAAGLIGWVCDARLKVEFINTSGNVYATYLSSLEKGCNAVGGWGWTVNANAKAGTIRFTLLSSGATVAVVQETIKS